MRLFISYSRKNKDWVYRFTDHLRSSHGYTVWIDLDIPVGQDWWQTILSEIENCDGFLIVLSPDSVASSYCMEELSYAHELSKPIIPLLLESCEIPAIINNSRIQYFTVEQRSNMINIMNDLKPQLDIMRDALTSEPIPRPRPSEPKLPPEESYEQAIAAFEQENYVVAERFLIQALEANPRPILKRLVEEKLVEAKTLVEAQKNYLDIARLLEHQSTRQDGIRAWAWYIEEYGNSYDPLHFIATYFNNGFYVAKDKIAEKQSDESQHKYILYLQNLKLTVLPVEIFKLKNLQHLSLSSNRFCELTPLINQLQNIERLELFNNDFGNFPLEITQLQNLENLNLNNNHLTEIPPEIGDLSNLRVLQIENNQIYKLPSEIGDLKNLQRLQVGSNQLKELPPKIGQLNKLGHLQIENNQLKELPLEIGQLENLGYLQTENNTLSELPKEIGLLSRLQTLMLSGNQFSSLPSEIGKLSMLQTLDLSNNQLRELPPEFEQLSNLRSLNLSNNKLSELSLEFGQLSKLSILNLSKNQLKKLPVNIGALYQLQRLDLNDNQITEFSSAIERLPNLRTLNLNNNNLMELSPFIIRLTNLTRLHIIDNNLSDLPLELGALPKLEQLYVVQGNPLTDLPQDVVAGGDDAVLQWLREQAKAKGLIS